VPFPESVRAPALALAGLLGGEVEAIRFETADAEAVLREAPPSETSAKPLEPSRSSYGAVTGRVQTLSSRSGLRFTLYDTLHDRAVSCYLEPGQEETMVDVWGRVATVEGWVSRDAVTGRPTAVRRISAVHPVEEEGELDGYRRARGVLRRRPDDPRAEERLRTLRDGE
jgi:hypothetical protein